MHSRCCTLGYILTALGAGLLLSLLVSGWLARVIVGLVLIVLGCLTENCR